MAKKAEKQNKQKPGKSMEAALKVQIILTLAKHKYPPATRDDVFKAIFEQAENFKKNRVENETTDSSESSIVSTVEEKPNIPFYTDFRPGCIPLYSLRAACGHFENSEMPEAEGWIDVSGKGFTPDAKRYFVIHAKGSSMLPKIKDGDLCVFEWYHGGSRDGETVLNQCRNYDTEFGGPFTIKKYHSEKKATDSGWGHSKIELIPLNMDYEMIELDGESEYRTIGVLKCVL